MTQMESVLSASGRGNRDTEPGNRARLMREFWDEKAGENAMYYISSYRAYDAQDPVEFWKWGGILAERFLAESGVSFTGRERMLEIGCGIGRMTRYLSTRFADVAAMDVSEQMIRQAREELADCTNIELAVGNGVDLSAYADASFDFVFSYIVFQHIPDTGITLDYIREAGRVLRPGGCFYFQVNTMPPVGALRGWLGGVKRRVLGRRRVTTGEAAGPGPRGLDHPAWQGSRVTRVQLVSAVTAGGMHIERTSGEGTQYTWVLARRAGDEAH